MTSSAKGIDQEVGADLFRQRPNPLGQRVALVGEGQFRTLFVQRLGNAPGSDLGASGGGFWSPRPSIFDDFGAEFGRNSDAEVIPKVLVLH